MPIEAGTFAERRRSVLDAPHNTSFSMLISTAQLNPERDLRFSVWTGIDFSNDDLRGFDFTGALMSDCRFSGAQIESAQFTMATVDRVALRQAADWDEYVRNWQRPNVLPNGNHLSNLATFSDSPIAPEMVLLPIGSFHMGASDHEVARFGSAENITSFERPPHYVSIDQQIAVAKYAVSFDEFDVFCRLEERSLPSDNGWGRGQRPVINVDWNDAIAYCTWLSKTTGAVYRLPSEAEWEFACRAGGSTPFSTGEAIGASDANFNVEGTDASSFEAAKPQTKHVDDASYDSNAFGLHQMHGNVWEWCADDFRESLLIPRAQQRFSFRNPLGIKAVRGGSWFNDASMIRSATRNGAEVASRKPLIGIRPVREL